MSRTPFDVFCKQFLETFLSPIGTVNINREIPGESRWVDVWFEPNIPAAMDSTDLGLLGRIAKTPCLIEPFRNQPPVIEVCNCKAKLFAVFGELQRQAHREKRSIPDSLEGFPWLWILAPSASERLLKRLQLTRDENELPGIYLNEADRTALIAINQLPSTDETLWIRLLGKGETQKRAIAQIRSFPAEDPLRSVALQLLVTWKVSLELTQFAAQEDEETMVLLSQVYVEWEERTKQQGVDQGIERGERSLISRQLNRRVGELSIALQSQIDRLSVPQLEDLGEALLDFSSIEDLTTWLENHSS